ncbi:MAG: N-6 DNA methylase, partial [Methanobacteriota archaeon]
GHYKMGKNQNELLDSHVEQILDSYESFSDIDGISKVASLKEISEGNFSLNISLYVIPVIEEIRITVQETLVNLKQAVNEHAVAEAKFKKLLDEMEVL